MAAGLKILVRLDPRAAAGHFPQSKSSAGVRRDAGDDGGVALGCDGSGGGWRPRTLSKLTGVRATASGEVRGMPHLQAQGARCP